MNSNQGNVFIEDRQQNQSYEQACDRKVLEGEDDSDNSDFNKINDEQIDQLLDDDNQTKQEIVLKFKVKELQKICNSLTSTNKKLINKVTSLEEQKQWNTKKEDDIFVDQYSELNGQFIQVQSLIRQYKLSLDQFQKSTLADMKLKQQKMQKMKSEIKVLKQKNSQLQIQKQDIEKINKQLQTRNEGLILQIQNIQKDKSRLQQKLNSKLQYYQQQQHHQHHGLRYDNHHGHQDYEMPSEIQNQYQMLIEKLVKELEYEKNIKKKMNEEIKRMSQELMESQRQIMSKNKKLYEIEMKLLKSSKTTADSSVNYSKLKTQDMRGNYSSRQEGSQRSAFKVQKDEQKFNFRSFAVLSVINGELDQQISNAERKIIGIKIVEFYQRKIQREDFSNVMPENLLVTNFSHKKPDILSIRKIGTSAYEDGEKTQESLVWNLAFIIDNLFGQIQGVQEFDETLSLTNQILQKQLQNNKQILLALKQTLYN